MGNVPLWVEAKTGEFSDKLQKLAKLRKRLGVEPENALLLSLQPLKETSRRAREKAASMRIVTLAEFDEALKERLDALLASDGGA